MTRSSQNYWITDFHWTYPLVWSYPSTVLYGPVAPSRRQRPPSTRTACGDLSTVVRPGVTVGVGGHLDPGNRSVSQVRSADERGDPVPVPGGHHWASSVE